MKTTTNTKNTKNTNTNNSKEVFIMNTKSIINVTINGMTAVEAIEETKSRLETIEKSAFNIALLCVYSLGDTIPSYIDSEGNEHGEATCEKPIKKQADLLKLIGRSKSTLSRWIKAIRLIISNNYFSDFASGELPFSYDKVITILENKEKFEGYIFVDLMGMTVDTLEAMTVTKEVKEDTEDDKENIEKSKEDIKEEVKEDTEDVATLIYNGNEYIVNKSIFEKWLSENATLA